MYVELPEPQVEALKAFAAEQGTGIGFEVSDAIRRHLAYPPARAPEPLPDAAPAAAEVPVRKGKRGSGI